MVADASGEAGGRGDHRHIGGVRYATALRLPMLSVSVREYRWRPSYMAEEATDAHSALMVLSPNQPRTVARYQGQGAGRDFQRVGKLSFAPAGVPLQWQTEGGSVEVLSCAFENRLFREVTALADLSDIELAASLDVRSGEIRQLLDRMAAEVRSPGFASEVLLEAAGMQMLVELARYFGKVRSDGRTMLSGTVPLSRLTDYLQALDGATPSLTALAEICGISRGHLIRSFKRQTGMTVHAYVEKVRMDRARTMLVAGGEPLKQIAYRLGFASPSHFSNAFRRHTSETPGAYRRRRTGN